MVHVIHANAVTKRNYNLVPKLHRRKLPKVSSNHSKNHVPSLKKPNHLKILRIPKIGHTMALSSVLFLAAIKTSHRQHQWIFRHNAQTKLRIPRSCQRQITNLVYEGGRRKIRRSPQTVPHVTPPNNAETSRPTPFPKSSQNDPTQTRSQPQPQLAQKPKTGSTLQQTPVHRKRVKLKQLESGKNKRIRISTSQRFPQSLRPKSVVSSQPVPTRHVPSQPATTQPVPTRTRSAPLVTKLPPKVLPGVRRHASVARQPRNRSSTAASSLPRGGGRHQRAGSTPSSITRFGGKVAKAVRIEGSYFENFENMKSPTRSKVERSSLNQNVAPKSKSWEKTKFSKPRELRKRLKEFAQRPVRSNMDKEDEAMLEKLPDFLNPKTPPTPTGGGIGYARQQKKRKTKKKKKPAKRQLLGKWMRKKGGLTYYLGLNGESYEGGKAREMARADKAAREKRKVIEHQIRSPSMSTDGIQFGNDDDDFEGCPSQDPKRRLEYYQVPKVVRIAYESKGITKLYKWQSECLQSEGVLDGKNLIYSAPTSGGKTMVAEILMLRRMILDKKKCLFILPYVSLVVEKTRDLKEKLTPLGYCVRPYHSTVGTEVSDEIDVMVCTIEKANAICNRLLEEGTLSKHIGVVVIDEAHMIGDAHRGYLLELLLTKLMLRGNKQQIIGLSATLPNIRDLSGWLEASLYITNFRPVPLTERYKIGEFIYNKQHEEVDSIAQSYYFNIEDPSQIVPLCAEIIEKGHSVLVFCATKEWCRKTARMVAKYLMPRSYDKESKRDLREIVKEQLRQLPGGICGVLEKTISRGVAYHHAGLTTEERTIIEDAFRAQTIDVLMATSTLAAGVNLPARRVIFRSPKIGRSYLTPTRYKQMAGRAGRAGIDVEGESILLAKKEERGFVKRLIDCGLEPMKSCLATGRKGLRRAILEVVSSGAAKTREDIHRFTECSLLYNQNPKQEIQASEDEAVTFLKANEFIQFQKVRLKLPISRLVDAKKIEPSKPNTKKIEPSKPNTKKIEPSKPNTKKIDAGDSKSNPTPSKRNLTASQRKRKNAEQREYWKRIRENRASQQSTSSTTSASSSSSNSSSSSSTSSSVGSSTSPITHTTSPTTTSSTTTPSSSTSSSSASSSTTSSSSTSSSSASSLSASSSPTEFAKLSPSGDCSNSPSSKPTSKLPDSSTCSGVTSSSSSSSPTTSGGSVVTKKTGKEECSVPESKSNKSNDSMDDPVLAEPDRVSGSGPASSTGPTSVPGSENTETSIGQKASSVVQNIKDSKKDESCDSSKGCSKPDASAASLVPLSTQLNNSVLPAKPSVDPTYKMQIYPTLLGRATFGSGLSPEEALFMHSELAKAREGLIVRGGLHLSYLLTPIFGNIEPSWDRFFQTFCCLPSIHKEVAEKVGISERYLALASQKPPAYQSEDPKAIIHKRFHTAILLHEIVQETPLSEISQRFTVDRGQLQSLQSSASMFGGMVAMFCQRLNFTSLAPLVAHFSERLNFGVQSELLPLLQIPHVKAFRARALFDSGLRTVETVANASVSAVTKAISKYNAFSSSNERDAEDTKYRQQVETQTSQLIIKGAKTILQSQIDELEAEAEQMELAQQQEMQLDRRRRRNQLQNDEHDTEAGIYDQLRMNVGRDDDEVMTDKATEN